MSDKLLTLNLRETVFTISLQNVVQVHSLFTAFEYIEP